MADLLATNSLNFCLSENVFISPLLLKDNFTRHGIPVGGDFFLKHSQYFTLLPSCLVCDETFQVIFIHFSSVSEVKFPPLILLRFSLSVFCTYHGWCCVSFLDLWFGACCLLWKMLVQYYFKYFLSLSFLSSPFLPFFLSLSYLLLVFSLCF